MKEITLEHIHSYYDDFLSDEKNIEIANIIEQQGILASCLNQELKIEGLNFDIVLPKSKIYHQYHSCQCNLYAAICSLKNHFAKNLEIDVKDLDISASYLDFFDKLEKINTAYNKLLESEITYEKIANTVERYVGIYGTFYSFCLLSQKYGLVPSEVMPEKNKQYSATEMTELLQRKVKIDALRLMKAQKKEENLEVVKNDLMKEAYSFLAKILGLPPRTFRYYDILYTPQQFFLKCNTLDYQKFITVTPYDIEDFKSTMSYIPSIYIKNKEPIERRTYSEIIQSIVNQLKNGLGIWFSSEENLEMDYHSGILSDELYDYESILNIQSVSGDVLLKLGILQYDHAMCITGVKLNQKGEVTHFLVDNSFGPVGPYRGRFIMPVSYFKKYVLTVVLYQNNLES